MNDWVTLTKVEFDGRTMRVARDHDGDIWIFTSLPGADTYQRVTPAQAAELAAALTLAAREPVHLCPCCDAVFPGHFAGCTLLPLLAQAAAGSTS